ncbi:Agamous-like MADS-box protein AGL80 [Euphorbia peplus]|nr:Agamous-like MADS-box protein AGL80 [Euphorbia peplus]
MTRKKVKLAFIVNDSARKATYKKRKKGLLKKVSELSTLCGIQACAIIYSPYHSQPEVWPPSPGQVHQVLAQFKRMPEMEQSKKMLNHEGFLRQRINKANDQLKKLTKDNREMEVSQMMRESLRGKSLAGLNIVDLNDLGWMLDQNMNEITKIMETLDMNDDKVRRVPVPVSESPVSRGGAGETVVVAEPPEQTGSEVDRMQREQWLMDLISPRGHGAGTSSRGDGSDEVLPGFSGENQNGLWSSAFFR